MSVVEMFLAMNAQANLVKGEYAITADLPNAGMLIVYAKREPGAFRDAVREAYARWTKAQAGRAS